MLGRLKRLREHVPGAGFVGSVLEIAGLAAIVAGIWHFSSVIGLIAAGIALFVTGLFVG